MMQQVGNPTIEYSTATLDGHLCFRCSMMMQQAGNPTIEYSTATLDGHLCFGCSMMTQKAGYLTSPYSMATPIRLSQLWVQHDDTSGWVSDPII